LGKAIQYLGSIGKVQVRPFGTRDFRKKGEFGEQVVTMRIHLGLYWCGHNLDVIIIK
jgi:hypothetical protein